MRFSWSWKLALMAIYIAAMCSCMGCKRAHVDPFPQSGAVAGWEKTGDTRNFPAKDLWQYIDGDADRYVKAGVVSVATSEYKYQDHLEAVVDVYQMGDFSGARKILAGEQSKDGKSVALGDEAIGYEQSVIFRKGPYLVRIVAYELTPDSSQTLLALAHGIETKL